MKTRKQKQEKRMSSFYPSNSDSRYVVAIWIAASSVMCYWWAQQFISCKLYWTRTWVVHTVHTDAPMPGQRELGKRQRNFTNHTGRAVHVFFFSLCFVRHQSTNSIQTLHTFTAILIYGEREKNLHSLRSNVEEPNYYFAMAFSMLCFEHSYLKTYWTRFENCFGTLIVRLLAFGIADGGNGKKSEIRNLCRIYKQHTQQQSSTEIILLSTIFRFTHGSVLYVCHCSRE